MRYLIFALLLLLDIYFSCNSAVRIRETCFREKKLKKLSISQ